MQKNILKSGIEISELGLGCMSLGTDYKKAQPIIESAIDNGITYFDTADIYDQGVNEEIVGKALKKYQNRDDIVIGTKVGNRLTDDGHMTWDPSKKHIKESVKGSLKRLGLNHLDLYQLHGGTIDDPLDETISAFDELKQEGYIRAYGISSIRPNVIDYYLKNSQIETLMSQFNLIDNRPESLINDVHDKQVKILARGPVFKGLLTSKSVDVIDEKFKNGVLDYTQDELGSTIASIKELESNLTALSFKYLTSHDAMGSIIVGASSVEQLEENVRNYYKEISLDQIKSARNRVKDIEYTQHLK
ncbi:aldo/keto reductase [Staphylococcus epidermidis]|jgi:aryl-alcohol dehydrogenase-like predicted oxidoreductase|uniref:Oxidoreductase, aldo/keto reductase family n=9 Tax=Bacillales TaxID=1385 RepID=Q5HP50_STAEQ|nr:MULTISPECIES: aldo/keto reductase [Staphylococcus]EHQ78359.1 oxidoreductase, aldo/keto reductase family protein [Staphylococcus epidermidis VCU057]EID35713.1 oxidoreductase, aldo/keto reductase family protein [Staphylococcus epidermidis IS-250]EJD80871.1 oxidoreductase, aldo/keto reductase family protein [Staphylococcus epidermidis NIHLM088]EJD85973.1 oxidoreductase, aldo/keto reductase family protein [Staphylococcus epidermidis NIHLM070]EON82378.1 aldo/keto reductase [Staphylococcus epider